MNNYIFDGRDIGALVYSILELGEDITVAEIGSHKAQSSCLLLQKCSNIKKIYLIDPYISYADSIYNEALLDEKDMDFIRLTAHHNVRYSGFSEKVQFLEMTEEIASTLISDESIDMLFIDFWLDSDNIYNQLNRWYNKIKPGGIFSGHDWHHPIIRNAIIDFNKNRSSFPVNNANNTWMWKK